MESRERVAAARVGCLGTVDADGNAHLVPVCFVLDGDVVYSAVDDKPKRTPHLARLANVRIHPVATVLVDHYDEDWSALWWVRVRGLARVVDAGEEHERAVALLRDKYPQYAAHRLEGPVLAVVVDEWRSWSAVPRD
ncbi:MAG: TIGR03668 family PPOX class F420-dependent oxidoreductase [Actinobacteria bacterium]|nr:TIGR03668 family PPOX class F420-dependent oxidoreductase [Actinomycetota bacterium]